MLELSVTPEFAGWFEALADDDAEAVATAVEVLGACAEDPACDCGSPYLLWYQNTASDLPAIERQLRTYLRTAELTRSVMRRMASPRVQARYRELPAQVASSVDDALTTLRRLAARAYLRSAMPNLKQRIAIAALASVFGDALAAPIAPRESSALRELQVPAEQPRFRILFGIDRERGAGLLVLGERLAREWYGDSVRRALAAWDRFRAGARDEVAPARAG